MADNLGTNHVRIAYQMATNTTQHNTSITNWSVIFIDCIECELRKPKSKVTSSEGKLDINETLVATASEAEGGVTLCLDEWTVNKNIELTNDV